MSESRGRTEPSMEEILASIRRIISQESQGPDAERRDEAAADPQPRPAQAEVLLLTEMVAEDGSVVSLADARAAAAGRARAASSSADAAPTSPVAPEPAGTGAAAPIAQLGAAAAPASMQTASDDQQVEKPSVTSETGKKDGLVSQESRAAAAAAFAELSRHVAREREAAAGGGRTVEDLVREALDPMLKNWLDTHLPTMVERVVRQEIQRVVRQAEDIA